MSVQVNQYLCYGYLLPYKEAEKLLSTKHGDDYGWDFSDKYHDSAFNEKIVEVNGFSYIADGMNGKFQFFGKIFQKSNNHEFMDTVEIPKVTAKVKKGLAEEFTNVFGVEPTVKPSQYLLTHYR